MDLLMIVLFVLGGVVLAGWLLPLLFYMRPGLFALVLWGVVLVTLGTSL